MTTLTKQQSKVLDFIWSRVSKRKPPPTIREIGRHMQISSPNGVVCHLKALRRKGWLEGAQDEHRGLRLTRSARKQLSGFPLVNIAEITER